MLLKRSSFLLLFVGLAGCVVAYASALFVEPGLADPVNTIVPIVLGLLVLYVGYRNVVHNHLLMWTPLPYFLGACALYFSAGPTLYFFGDKDLIWRVNQTHPVTSQELLTVNLLNTISILMIMGAYYLALRWYGSYRSIVPRERAARGPARIKLAVLLFLGIGLPVKYLIILPYQLGITDTLVAGVVIQLQYLIPVAIVLLCILAFRCGGIWHVMFYATVAAELLTSTLTFAKTDVLTTLVMLTLGAFAVYPRPRTLAAGFLAVLIAYVLLVPLVFYGRSASGEIEQAGLAERLEIVRSYLAAGAPKNDDQVQVWWERLSYAKHQAFAMGEYDRGRPGDTVVLALYIPIPRAVWPDKPAISVGREFYFLMAKTRHALSAPGIFAEAYWNGGWWLVVFVCVYVGGVFAGFTVYAVRRVALQQFLFLPVIFFGIKMGFRPDGWFASTYVGDLLNAVLLHVVLAIVAALIPARIAATRAAGIKEPALENAVARQ